MCQTIVGNIWFKINKAEWVTEFLLLISGNLKHMDRALCKNGFRDCFGLFTFCSSLALATVNLQEEKRRDTAKNASRENLIFGKKVLKNLSQQYR